MLRGRHVKTFAGKDVAASCLYFFDEPVSPHLAVQRARAAAASASSLSKLGSSSKGKGKQVLKGQWLPVGLRERH